MDKYGAWNIFALGLKKGQLGMPVMAMSLKG
jgi:hypothetical protein